MDIDTDWHVHPFQTTRDLDGMRHYAEAALARGLRKVVFTEHAPLGPAAPANAHFLDDADLDRYIACAEQTRADYAGRLEIAIGVEADYHPALLGHLEPILARYPWDYVLGSVHPLTGHWAGAFAGLEGPAYAEKALAATSEAIDSGLFDTIAHLDFFRWRRENDDPDFYLPERHGDAFHAIFAKMAAAGVALELNTSGLNKRFGSFLPCRTVWDWSRAYPLRRAYGSDAHLPERVGESFDVAVRDGWFVPAGKNLQPGAPSRRYPR